jgi:hypothetical protein
MALGKYSSVLNLVGVLPFKIMDDKTHDQSGGYEI